MTDSTSAWLASAGSRRSTEAALSFRRLQSLLDLTAGNLITHLRRLEEAGYVEDARSGAGRSATTTVRLSTTGRQAFDRYSAALRSLLDAAPVQS